MLASVQGFLGRRGEKKSRSSRSNRRFLPVLENDLKDPEKNLLVYVSAFFLGVSKILEAAHHSTLLAALPSCVSIGFWYSVPGTGSKWRHGRHSRTVRHAPINDGRKIISRDSLGHAFGPGVGSSEGIGLDREHVHGRKKEEKQDLEKEVESRNVLRLGYKFGYLRRSSYEYINI